MNNREKAERAIKRWQADPVLFVREALGGAPDEWQLDALVALREHRRIALSACKGPGKSKLLNWIIWWLLFCFVDAQVMALSITSDNLRDNLWKELAATHARVDILRATFDFKAEAIRRKSRPRTWWCVARAFAKDANKEAQANTLAGFHGEHIMVVLDECGGIPVGVLVAADAIFANATDARLVIAGNPTTRNGALGHALLKGRDKWHAIYITGDPNDPKRSPRISIEWAREMIEEFGEDNPWVQVNVFGRFPNVSPDQLIRDDKVAEAQTDERDPLKSAYRSDPIIWGVDPGRFGDDEQVLMRRQGILYRRAIVWRNQDGPQLGSKIAVQLDRVEGKPEFPDAVFIDVGGVGSGAYDFLVRAHYGVIVHPIDFGAAANDTVRYADKRTEMWFTMAKHINRMPVSLPVDPVLAGELVAPKFDFRIVNRRTVFILESKKEMKKRGVQSPNRADASALTHAGPVNSRTKEEQHRQQIVAEMQMDPNTEW